MKKCSLLNPGGRFEYNSRGVKRAVSIKWVWVYRFVMKWRDRRAVPGRDDSPLLFTVCEKSANALGFRFYWLERECGGDYSYSPKKPPSPRKE